MRDYEYGTYLYNLRKSIKISQNELGKMLGVSNKAISKWETGESRPALKQLYGLAKIFNVPLEELIEVCNRKNKSIYKIVITGGPCAGKSTAMTRIQEEYSKHGFAVLFIPESATDIILSGITFSSMSNPLEFQKIIATNQLNKEKLYESTALNMVNADKVLIVCDRGVIDGKAYLNPIEYNQLLRNIGTSEVELRDNYDAVFHLVTAAKGAEKFYSYNNPARGENLEEARLADDKVLSAWAGHPHLRVIDNSSDFEEKMNRLLHEISIFLGEPTPYEIERKFLIKMPDISKITNPTLKKLEIIQTYLKSSNPDEEIRIRQRGTDGNFIYTKTIKKKVTDIKRMEVEKRISKDEYLSLLLDADENKRQIRKTRYCLVHENQYLEIDIYPFWQDKAILEIELSSETDEISLPKDIHIIKEVTGDEEYHNSSLAKLNLK